MNFISIIAIAIFFPALAFSGGDRETDQFLNPRTEAQCTTSSEPLKAWMVDYVGTNPINDVLGRPRRQADGPFCFAITAADLLSWEIKWQVSTNHAMQFFYYTNVGKFLGFFKPKHGGLIDTTLRAAAGKRMCLEQDLPYNDDYDTAMASSCEEPKAYIDENLSVRTVSTRMQNGRKLFPVIDEQLDRGNLVGIHYRVEAMLTNSDEGVTWANHASSVVGRYWSERTGTCSYVIRNSWGSSCRGPLFCRDGYYEVPESRMDEAAQEAIYIE